MPDAAEAPPAIALDDMVCFNLHSAYRAVTAVYRPLLEPLGVTYPQYLVLAALWDAGDLSVGEIVARLQSEYGTITPLVKRMEHDGLLVRRRNPADERSVIVSLTPAGDALRVHGPRIYQAVVDTFGFTPKRADAALEVLRAITAVANQSTANGPTPTGTTPTGPTPTGPTPTGTTPKGPGSPKRRTGPDRTS